MDNDKELFNNFATYLKNHNSKKPFALYKVPDKITTKELPNEVVKPKDIIYNVSSQIKALQGADFNRCSKYYKKNLQQYKKAEFLPLNLLPNYVEIPTQSYASGNKFETQGISDTQLVDIVENAEALVETSKSMTQEFDTIINHTHTESGRHKYCVDNKHANDTFAYPKNMNPLQTSEKNDCYDNSSKETTTKHDSESVDGPNKNNVSVNGCRIKIEAPCYRDRPRSPVLLYNSRITNRKSNTPSPLVVNLDHFETFESVAVPIISENLDFTTAKHLINSQIIDKELCIQAGSLGRNIIKVVNEDYNWNCKKDNDYDLVDEILFSSDEEEYINEKVRDLPLTCALESSRFNEFDALNNTMYVGFQTASNKSIQVSSDSFSKAKSMLDESENAYSEREFFLTELVEKTDIKNGRSRDVTKPANTVKLIQIEADNSYSNIQDGQGIKKTDQQTTLKDFNFESLNQTTMESLESSNLLQDSKNKTIFGEENAEYFRKTTDTIKNFGNIGFTTAANKSIKGLNQALARCKRVFQDIDVSENLHPNIFKNHKEENIIPRSKKARKAKEIKSITTENDFLAKFKIDQKSLIEEFNNSERDKDLNKIELAAFKTASNKSIIISDLALFKTKRIFQDIEMCDNTKIDDMKFFENADFTLFKTASNKDIVISDKVLSKTNNVFQDFEIDDTSKTTAMKMLDENFVGFKTASNKEIIISKQAVSRTKGIFQDIEQCNNTETDETRKFDKNAIIAGFKTASNKEITISEQALSKTKSMFQDMEIDESKTTVMKMFDKKKSGFKATSNKEIMISEQAFYRTKDMLQDMEKCNTTDITGVNSEMTHLTELRIANVEFIISDQNEKSSDLFQDKIKSNIAFAGFKTASDKKIHISEQALNKTKRVFQNIETKHANKVTEMKTCINDLKTASNAISISEQALPKTKNILPDINIDANITKVKDPNSPIKFGGFKTASNKKITISEHALSKTKNIFQDIDIHDGNLIEKKRTSDTFFTEFEIVSNKKTTVTKQESAKPDVILQDKHRENDSKTSNYIGKPYNVFIDAEISKNIYKEDFQIFKTANAKQVLVSADALHKTKNIFENIKLSDNHKHVHTADNSFNDPNIVNRRVASFTGFKTASNKHVEISEDALTKGKLLFQEISNFNENSAIQSKTVCNNSIKIDKQVLNKLGDLFDAKNDGIEKNDFDHNWNNEATTLVKGFEKPTETDFKKVCIKFSSKQTVTESNVEEMGSIFDTQVHNDFEQTLYTEDFCKLSPPKPLKRSVSPVFACPKAKKRKRFETPYKNNTNIHTDVNIKVNLKENNQTNIIFHDDYKKDKKYKLLDLGNLEKAYQNVFHTDSYLLNFSLSTLLEFKFIGNRNDLTDTEMNLDSLKRHFLTAVNKNIVPEEWLDNHLKLILWKLISYEKDYPNVMKNTVSVTNVLKQLKYRYNRELYNVERPALRKILEKDDVSTRTMVLRVIEISEDGASEPNTFNISNKIELLLSDGWYCIKATIDKMLAKLVCDKKIVVGNKIATHGAELLNCDQGVSPLEDISMVRLKLFGNSTRPAKWHARLGYHGNAAILTRLSTIKPEGGKVSKLRLHVTRVYPTLYVEKFADGSTVTRSERLENLYQMNYETEREILIEKLYEEVEKEYSDQESQDSEGTDMERKCLDSGSQIARMIRKCKDPNEFKSNLTKSQLSLLEEYLSRQGEKMFQELNRRFRKKLTDKGLDARNVVQLLKIRVAGIEEKNGAVEVTKGLMSVWTPNDAILELITEGAWIEVLNVVPTAIRYGEIQISASRQSVFMQSKYKENDKMKSYTKSLKRICYEIKDLAHNPALSTDYNEIDTVGLVFLIEPSIEEFNCTKDQNFQNVFLTDANKSIISLNFWGGLKKFGFENVLDTGQIVCGINLQKRAGNSRKSIPQFRVTELSYFTKTPKSESAKKIMEDLFRKFTGIDKSKFCDDCIILKENYSSTNNIAVENVTPYRINNSDYDISKTKMYIETPFGGKNKRIDDNFNLTGLDFESTFKQTDTQDLSPKSFLRKKRLNEKLAKLKMYGEPPPLSTIHILNKSKNATNAYKSPVFSKSNISDCVASVEKKVPDGRLITTNEDLNVPTSPIIMNRTFIRNSVNPVRLNFSNNIAKENNSVSDFVDNVNDLVENVSDLVENVSDLVDHFAEEFDASPPLSLDSSDCV